MQLHSRCVLLFLITFLSAITAGCGTIDSTVASTALPPPKLLIATQTPVPSMAPSGPPTPPPPDFAAFATSFCCDDGTPDVLTPSKEQIALWTHAVETQEAPWPQSPISYPTEDHSTTAPPAAEWATYSDEDTDVSFKYPANWFFSMSESGQSAFLSNAPPTSVVAIKGYADSYIKITINLKPKNIEAYGSIKGFIDSTIISSTPPEMLIAAEELPSLSQGYTAFRVVILGLGELYSFYVANGNNMIGLHTSYVPGTQADKEYLYIVEQIANTLLIPPN